MRRHSFHFGLFLAGVLAVGFAAAPKTPGPPPLSPRFKQVRERIDALFADRSTPPPNPTLLDNPFRPPGAIPAEPEPTPENPAEPAPAAPVSSDLETLQQAVATLRVTGTFNVGGEVHLVINARPYKAGDVLQVSLPRGTVYLRVREIAPNLVTLTLNEAEMTLKY